MSNLNLLIPNTFLSSVLQKINMKLSSGIINSSLYLRNIYLENIKIYMKYWLILELDMGYDPYTYEEYKNYKLSLFINKYNNFVEAEEARISYSEKVNYNYDPTEAKYKLYILEAPINSEVLISEDGINDKINIKSKKFKHTYDSNFYLDNYDDHVHLDATENQYSMTKTMRESWDLYNKKYGIYYYVNNDKIINKIKLNSDLIFI